MSEREVLRAVVRAVQNYVEVHPLPPSAYADDVYTALRQYDEWNSYAATIAAKQVRSRACQWCGVPMFFAREPHGEYWVPFEVERIPSKEVQSQYRHVIDFDGLTPVMHWDAMYKSDVWVDHRMVCGRWPDPRPGVGKGILLRKWKFNRAAAKKMEAEEMAQLEKTLRSIAEG